MSSAYKAIEDDNLAAAANLDRLLKIKAQGIEFKTKVDFDNSVYLLISDAEKVLSQTVKVQEKKVKQGTDLANKIEKNKRQKIELEQNFLTLILLIGNFRPNAVEKISKIIPIEYPIEYGILNNDCL
jgi:hypothetical protein